MSKKLNVLIIDDSEYDCELILHTLKKSGYDMIWERVDSEEEMAKALKLKQWDVILSDHSMPYFSSIEALRVKRELGLDIPFIIVSGKIGEEQAIEVMRNGCNDYVSKDQLLRLGSVIERELEDAEIKSEKKRMESELSTERENLNTIVNAAPIGMIIIDENARIVKANEAIINMLKSSSGDILNKRIGDAFKCLNSFIDEKGCGYSEKCKYCVFRNTLLEVFNSGVPRKGIEIMHRLLINGVTKDTWFRINSVPINIDRKKHIVVVLDDITEQKQYEIRIKDSRDFYLTLFENFPSMIWRTNKNKESDYFNSKWFDFTGTTLSTDKGFGWLECVHPEDREKITEAFVDDFDRQVPVELEYRLRRYDGQYRWVLDVGRPFYDMNGNFEGYIGIVHDITERKMAEEELKRYQTLSDNANDIIIFSDMDGNVLDVNKSALREYGYSKDEILTKSVYDIRHQEKSDLIRKQLEKAADEGIIFETTHYRKDGTSFFVEVSSTGTLIQNKRVILSVIRDVTERKKIAIELENAKAAAEEANRAKSEFLANMSHEIRTPLNGIIGMTDLTLLTELNDEQKENLDIVKSCGISLLRVINDILDFSKIEAGKMTIENISFNIGQLIDGIYKTHIVKAQEKGIELLYEIGKNVPSSLTGDPNRLAQVLNNLISNAVKFTDMGNVSINIENVQDNKENVELKFTISDTGIGISKEDKDKLFRNFSQVDGSITRKYGGTGLGLTISKRLVELMDGKIWFESEKGRGSKFYFTVKLGIGREKNNDRGGTQKIKIIEEHDEKLNILVVEDDRTNQMVISSMLKVKENKVDIANNGKEALNMLDNNKYDLILMDIQMPEMDGIETTLQIRLQEQLTNMHIPIIALTAHAIQGDRERFLSVGMDYYISKPVHIEDLYNTIEKAMTRKEKGLFNDINILGGYNTPQINELEIGHVDEALEEIETYLKRLESYICSCNFIYIEQIAHKIKELAVCINENEIKNAAFKIELSARKEESICLTNQYEGLVKEYKRIVQNK